VQKAVDLEKETLLQHIKKAQELRTNLEEQNKDIDGHLGMLRE
jgi:hypothetical protein